MVDKILRKATKKTTDLVFAAILSPFNLLSGKRIPAFNSSMLECSRKIWLIKSATNRCSSAPPYFSSSLTSLSALELSYFSALLPRFLLRHWFQ